MTHPRPPVSSALPRWLRVVTVTTHVTAVGAWVGLDIALIAVTPATTVLSSLTAVAAGLTIATGVTLAVHRPWGGLDRHLWIGVKIRIALVLAAAGITSVIGLFDPTTVLTARVCALIALIAAIAVSVTKPWGLTRAARTPDVIYPAATQTHSP